MVDHLYDAADTFDEVYTAITEQLVNEARTHGEILYAVPGSPLVLERTVRNLLERDDVDTHIEPAISFLDDAWRALGVDPVERGVRLIDGHDFAAASAGYSGPMLVAHTHANWVLSDVKLSIDNVDDSPVAILHHLGLPDERVVHTIWSDIDRVVDMQMARLDQRLDEQDIRLTLSPEARERIADEGYDPAYGARPLKRVIQKRVQDPLAMEMLTGAIKPGDDVQVDVEDDALVMRPRDRAAA